MTTESAANNGRTSFFDDDDLNIEFSFQKPGNRQIKDMTSTPVLSNILLRPSTTDGLFQQGYYILHSKTMAYYKHTLATQAEAVLDLSHARMIPLLPTPTVAYHGFALIRNGSRYEFYSPDEKTIEGWVNQLKTICVLGNFHEEYKALKMIGKGSFAKVYLVESKFNSAKTYAVKAFTKESVIASNKGNAKSSMWNEIDIMRALDHEKVIKLYEVYETEKSIYLVLELIQGRSLQELLKKEGFKDNEPRIINVISSLLEALAYLASKGVMHRDLKPDNILIDKSDKIKIVDFGLATFIDVPEYIFKKCGTPGYIAPEVFKYDHKNPSTNYDGKCDVFSTGCILYFMLFGRAFFEGANASEILKVNRRFTNEFENLCKARREAKDPITKFSRESLDMLLQLLDIEQKTRPTAAQTLTHPYIAAIVHQKQAGTYDFYQNNVSSPLLFDKRSSFVSDLQIQPRSGATTVTPLRFAEKDSLYLDVGKPDITGRIDTITSGSSNNSMLLASRVQSHADQSPSLSPFGKLANRNSDQSPTLSPFGKGAQNNRGFKSYVTGLQPGMIKTGGYRTEGEGGYDYTQSGLLKSRLEEVKNDRRFSEIPNSKAPDFSANLSSPEYLRGFSNGGEDSRMESSIQNNHSYQGQGNIGMKLGVHHRTPSKGDSATKRATVIGNTTYGVNYAGNTIGNNNNSQSYRNYDKGA